MWLTRRELDDAVTRVLVENLRKEFGSLVAVEDLTLEVRDREFMCLLGPSGCGKTTTLNCISGLERPTKGRILFDDTVMNDIPAKDRGLGFVFQNFALFHHMSVFDNLSFAPRIRRVPKSEISKEVDEIAAFLDVKHLLKKKAGTLSSSEKQRVAIGRTLLSKPRILLLDEPLSNVDALTRATMRAELKKMVKEVGQTTVYVTHDQLEAVSMADRIAVMSTGKLQQYDTPDAIYNNPKNRFVANFVGSPSMNLVDCSYSEKNGKCILIHGGFTLDVTDLKEAITRVVSSSEIVIGIRPEYITVASRPLSQNSVRVKVSAIEPLGAETYVDLQFEKETLRAVVPGMFEGQIGDSRYLEFKLSHLNVFDRKTGISLIDQ